MDFVVDVLVEGDAVLQSEVEDDVEVDGFSSAVEVEAVHFEDAFVGEDDVVDVVLDFGDGFVFGVDGVNADGVEDDAEFFEDGLRDAAGDLVEFGDGEGVF